VANNKHDSKHDREKAYAERAKEASKEVAQEAQERARELKDKVQAQAQEAKEKVQAQAEESFQRGKGRLVEQIESVAKAFRKTGEQLREEDQSDLAGYAERIADQVEHVSGYLERKGLRGVAHDVEDLARKSPALFVGGALVLGLVAVRFLRAGGSSDARHR
jgi:chromatin segregation and condensation protein Rec8/ScpA/Scc1 (kleisin family)